MAPDTMKTTNIYILYTLKSLFIIWFESNWCEKVRQAKGFVFS